MLAYLSASEHDQTVFVKRKEKYYFRKQQGTDYMKKLPEVFFEKGYGVFLPGDVRDAL